MVVYVFRETKELEFLLKREQRIEHGKQARVTFVADLKEQRRKEVIKVLVSLCSTKMI